MFYAVTSNVVFFLGVSLEGREATHPAALTDKGINLITFINEVNEVNLYTQFIYHFNNCIGVDFISIFGNIYILFVYAACLSEFIRGNCQPGVSSLLQNPRSLSRPTYAVYLEVNHKVHVYLEYHSVCPLVRIGTPHPSLSLDSGILNKISVPKIQLLWRYFWKGYYLFITCNRI